MKNGVRKRIPESVGRKEENGLIWETPPHSRKAWARSYSGYTGRPVGGGRAVLHDGFATYPAVRLSLVADCLFGTAVIVTSIRCSSREDLLHRRKSLSHSPSLVLRRQK